MAKAKGNRIGFWIIMGLLFVGLIGFGATGLNGTVRTLGTVGEKQISVQQFANALNRQLRAFSAQMGVTLTMEQARAFGLDRQVLSQMITDRALDNEAARLGLSVGDAQVRDRVLAFREFTDISGEFDREAYRFALQQSGLSETEFEEQLRDDAARSILQAAVVSGVAEPDVYAETLAAYIGERRDPTWIALTAADLVETPAEPTEEELRTFWSENPDLFSAPEIRNITFAWLTPEMMANQVTVDEAGIEALYQQRIADFVQPERRLVERLVMPTLEAATEARAALDAGTTDFEALVAARGLDLADTDLGDVSIEELGAAGDAVFSATPGDVLGPLDTSLGPAFFRLNAVLAANEVTLEEAADDLRAELADSLARDLVADAAEPVTDLIAGGARIEDIAEQTDFVMGQIAWSEGITEGIAAYQEFREAAQAAQEGAFPELFSFENGGDFVLRLDSITPPAVIPFEEARGAVAVEWSARAEREAVLAFAEMLAQDVRDSDLFRVEGRAAVVETGLIRRDFIEGTPPEFITTVFEMAEDEVRVLPTADGAIVIRLDGIAPADMTNETIAAERETIAERLSQSLAQDIYGAFAGTIQSQTDITLNQAAVDAVMAQYQ